MFGAGSWGTKWRLTVSDEIHVEMGGSAGTPVVLLHGLGSTADVWGGLIQGLGDRRWIAIDFPGHGGSKPLTVYSPEHLALTIVPHIPRGAVLLGHSLGGVVALALAQPDFDLAPKAVFGLGIKVVWTPEELASMAQLAARPRQQFETEAEAQTRALRLAGMTSGLLRRAVHMVDGKWETSFDPRALGVGEPEMATLIKCATCPVHLACGSDDPMVTVDQLRKFDPEASELTGSGHNAMIDSPRDVINWLGGHGC